MYDELTQVDIDKMKEEIEYRKLTLRPQLGENLRAARAQGDLSENYEYKVAKGEVRRNNSRITYLENIIKTAKVISAASAADAVGLFDRITVHLEEDDEDMSFVLTTTLRQDSLSGYISKESPLGKAVLGKKKGERVTVRVNESYTYHAVITGFEKGEDDPTLAISSY